MGQTGKEHLTAEKCAENLANFAIDRTDLKEILNTLPADSGFNPTTVEYELQILKILSVGWAISLYIPSTDETKQPLSNAYWGHIREIADNISSLTGTTTGKEIDYFEIIKERLDSYVDAMQANPDQETLPSSIMGKSFARACMSPDNAAVILAGEKMFVLTVGAVKEYLDSVTVTIDRKDV